MKLLKLAAFAAVILLAGCATTSQPPVLAAQVKKACAVAQPTVASLQALSADMTNTQQADLGQASFVIDHVCTATVPALPQNLTQFVQTAFPLVIKIVAGSSLDQQTKRTTVIALTVAQAAVSAAMAQ
ncbi:MAG: hypothetical protein EPN46_01015 [Candidimonas sp.]|nr:MAG: hypothetical protein EPN62_02775 [Candidimonas sp.]TAM80766.1 MAG: hypothetical protein EPN46_01015 [Candidimonas sp.]